MKKIGYDKFIQFNPDNHTYSDVNGNTNYVSVSGLLKYLSEPFDEKTMSYAVAKSRVNKGESILSIVDEQANVLKEWHNKRDNSCTYGTNIHEKLEYYFKTGVIDKEYKDLAESIAKFIGKVGCMMQEVKLYSEEHRIAGTTDICVQRVKNGNVWNFYDYKTCDIHFKSMTKLGKLLNKFMLEPVTHLEDCNYNKYALQLSLYALMAELTYGIIVGDLAILEITKQNILVVHPVAYLRTDAMNIFAIRKKELGNTITITSTQLDVYDNPVNVW